MDDFGGHLTFAGIAVWVIQWLKTSRFAPWITAETGKINRAVSAVIAILSGFGIHAISVWNPTAHTFTLTIGGLDGNMLMEGLVGTVETFVWQQLFYHGMLKGKL